MKLFRRLLLGFGVAMMGVSYLTVDEGKLSIIPTTAGFIGCVGYAVFAAFRKPEG